MKQYNESIFWDRMTERVNETLTSLKENRAPNIIRFAVHVTSNCNLRCPYCKEDKVGPFMNRDLFGSIAYRAGKMGIVHITGGEPMTVPWLEDELYNLRDVTRFALNTNMLIMPKPNTLKTIFRLKTSFDTYRPQLSKIWSNIIAVSKMVEHTSVCFTATHNNVDKAQAFVDLCKTEAPDLYSIAISFYKGSDRNMILTSKDISKLFEVSETMDPISNWVFMETHSISGNYFPENLNIPCYLSMTERLIDEKGDEYYCSHLFRDKVLPPGFPGKDSHCVTGCNAKFRSYNKIIHELLIKEKV